MSRLRELTHPRDALVIYLFFKVVLPLMVPGIAAATVLTWTTMIAELSAASGNVILSWSRPTWELAPG